MKKKTTLKDDIELAELRAAGCTLQTIATKKGIDKSTVSRKLNREEVKAYIEEIHSQLLKNQLPKSVDNIKFAINRYQHIALQEKHKLKPTDLTVLQHGYRASERMLESVGILPSHIPVLQILNESQTIINADVLNILQQLPQSKAALTETLQKQLTEAIDIGDD
jgi:IS30 family transposase